jgi:hypothetical protein
MALLALCPPSVGNRQDDRWGENDANGGFAVEKMGAIEASDLA